MDSPTCDRIPVTGADLYYEMRGAGPLLLLLQGGDGPAARAATLAQHLAAHYTVVVYDRRGIARSTPHEPRARVDLAVHADDLHRLLSTLTDAPATVFGSSFGALVAFTNAVRHPGQIGTLVAHDPAIIGLLDGQARRRAESDLDTLVGTFRQAGTEEALRTLARLVDADFSDREPGVEPPEPPGPAQLADLEFFFRHDLPEIGRAALGAADLLRVTSDGTRVIPAAGRLSRRTWNYDCARAMAEILGTEITEFPGGHSLSTHPQGFGTRLHALLGGMRRTD